MSKQEDDLNYACATYTADQFRPHATACEQGKCQSYIHCFFGSPRHDQQSAKPMPVCARRILASLDDNDVPHRSNRTDKSLSRFVTK